MVRDTNAPRRPLTGYIRYIATIRKEVAQESGLKGIKLTPLLSARWNQLSEEEKNEFSKSFAMEMTSYREKMTAYKKTSSYEEFQAKKKAKKFGKRPKDKTAPKRAATSFMIFCSEVRPQVTADLGEEATIGTMGKKIGQMWGELTAEAKQVYVAQANKAKEAHQEVLAAYKETQAYRDHQEKVAAWTLAKKNAQKKSKKVRKVKK